MNSCTFRCRHVEGIRHKHSACFFAEARAILGEIRHNPVYYPSLTVKGAIQTIRVVRPIAAISRVGTRSAASRQIPAGRFGTPADVARAVMFFADPKASFITGQTLFVCGGTSIGSIVF